MRGQSNPDRFPSLPRIGIDILGSDTPPHLLLDAVLLYANTYPDRAHFVIFGEKELGNAPFSHPSVELVETKDSIHMDENPLKAIKKKKHSSLVLGIMALKEGKLDAFISCGNSGALLAAATLHLTLLSDIARPALLALLPTLKDPVAVIDVGANTSSTAKQLIDFAKIGVAYQKSLGKKSPSVGLLNIGVEPHKGTALHREAYEHLFRCFESSFTGNLEAREVFKGNVDVVVTDGFSGNILLKASEGLGEMVVEKLKKSEVELEKISDLTRTLSYNQYPGALLAGLQGLVMKCHGAAHPTAILQTIDKAIALHKNNFIYELEKHLH